MKYISAFLLQYFDHRARGERRGRLHLYRIAWILFLAGPRLVLAPPCFRKVVKYGCLINSKVSDRCLTRDKSWCSVKESSRWMLRICIAAVNPDKYFWYQAKELVFFVQFTFPPILRRNDETCRVKLFIKEENALRVSHTYFFFITWSICGCRRALFTKGIRGEVTLFNNPE